MNILFWLKKISLLFKQHIVEKVLSIQIIKSTHCFFFMLHNNFQLLTKYFNSVFTKNNNCRSNYFLTVILFSISQKSCKIHTDLNTGPILNLNITLWPWGHREQYTIKKFVDCDILRNDILIVTLSSKMVQFIIWLL